MIVKYLRIAIVLLAGLQLAGCYTDYGPVEVERGPISFSGAGVASLLRRDSGGSRPAGVSSPV